MRYCVRPPNQRVANVGYASFLLFGTGHPAERSHAPAFRKKSRGKSPRTFTHILHAPSIPPDAKVPPAACGAKVSAKAFINNKANVERTCEGCAQVWREHYKGK